MSTPIRNEGAPLSYTELEMLIAGLIRYEAVAKTAMKWLTEEHLNASYYNTLPGLLWVSLTNSISSTEVAPTSADFFIMLFNQVLSEVYSGDVDVDIRDRGYAVIKAIFAAPIDEAARKNARGMLSLLHKTYIVTPELNRAAFAAQQTGDYSELIKIQGVLTAAGSEIAEEKIFSDPLAAMDKIELPLVPGEEFEDTGMRIRTGTIFDAMHKGLGPYRGLASMVLGATSGGKTTLVYHTIAECCALGHSVGLISTEEDLDVSAMAKQRLFAACTDRNTDEWEKAGNDPRRLTGGPLSRAQIDRINKLRKNTTFYSFANTPSWEDLEARVLASKERNGGKHHDILFIDWAGPLAQVISNNSKNKAIHQCLEEIAFNAQELAKKTGTAVFLMHQLASESVKKLGTFGKYTEFDSQNCKKMAQYMGSVYVISPYNPEMRFNLTGCKLRGDVKNFQVVGELDPTHSRVRFLESMTTKGNAFREKGKDTGPKEPGKAFRKAD